MVVEFLRVRLLHSAAPKVSVGAFGFVWYVLACPGDSWVHSGLFDSFGRVLAVFIFTQDPSVVGFIRVPLGALLGGSCSFGFFRFISDAPFGSLC